MTFIKLTLRSISFYRGVHALTLSGTILAAAILVGALLLGDSIKFSLTQSALLRLGNIHWAMESRGRYFPADLAIRLSNETQTTMSPALLFRGIALSSGGTGMEPRQINNIQILGVPDLFWNLATGPKPRLTPDGIAINQKLATALQAKRGDQISIRFSKPTLMSRDAPLSSRDKNDTLRATFSIEDIVQDNQLGRFNLAANPQIPYTVFINLPGLQETAGIPRQANLLLAGGSPNLSVEKLNQTVRKVWQLADAGLTLKPIDGGQRFQLGCDRIFMDPSIATALPALTNSIGALTYLVNSIARTNGVPLRETPYSFVVALTPSSDPALGRVPSGMADDEIIVNRWLADQLNASTGDAVRITYYEFQALNQFIETNRIFKILRIIEMNELKTERELSPNFPGLTLAGKCADWDIGMPLRQDKLEDSANEAYWNDYRATPKALVTLKAGQSMWGNKFGNLTGVRFWTSHQEGINAISRNIQQQLNPSELGLAFLPVRQTALKAAGEAMDFGQLFLGMSFFLIVASLMLTGLLFTLGIQQRAKETGLLLAVGFRPGQIRRLWFQECTVLAALGAIAGALLGALYTKAMIWGLGHFWQGAVAQAEIQYHATIPSLVTGAVLSFAFSMAALIFALWRQTASSTQALLVGESAFGPGQTETAANQIPRWKWLKVGAMTGIAVALGLIGYACKGDGQNRASYFFAAGSLLLISLLLLVRILMTSLTRTGGRLTLMNLGLRNAGRHPSRSVTVAGLLACGCFLILAVSAMQEDIEGPASQRDSGTGGFALFGESTLPIQADLNNLDPASHTAHIVSMKIRDGDDASCLNLNRAQSPTLIGVPPKEFEKRRAFQPSKGGAPLWTLLNESLPDGTIPGLTGDANTAEWGLEKKVGTRDGDILILRDERGVPFRVKLVGTLPVRLSVFQGSVLISARDFARYYPSEQGSRLFLIDTPPETEHAIQKTLTLKLEKWGINITSTKERLKSFYAVETTYMAMFLVLGGLGLLLGSAGLTFVILRNIQERRGELAILAATGYSPRQVLRVVLAEHGFLLGLGLSTGITAALAAIWPTLQAPGVHLPWIPLMSLICGMILFHILWILLAIRLALRIPLVNSLRNQ